jgi:hypothetical protein
VYCKCTHYKGGEVLKNRIKELREERAGHKVTCEQSKNFTSFFIYNRNGAANPSVVNAVMISSALGKTVEEVFIGLSKEEK